MVNNIYEWKDEQTKDWEVVMWAWLNEWTDVWKKNLMNQ